MMDLSSEDALRINVLLAGAIEVIRIDESSMTVFALSNNKEAKVKLNPNCRDESYLKRVKAMIRDDYRFVDISDDIFDSAYLLYLANIAAKEIRRDPLINKFYFWAKMLKIFSKEMAK